MAIFMKDGKVYILDGPNPAVEGQERWDPSKLVFHNFSWDEVRPQAIETPEAEAVPRATPPSEPKEEDPEAAAPYQAESEGTKEFDLPLIKYKVLCHCLPATVERKRDSFYGESWERVRYGEKFVFPCIVVSSTDLSLEFWTSDPKGQVSEKSVVYPFAYEVHNKDTGSYDRVPYDDYRWWRISSREPKEGGWLFVASPSDMQPDFSD